MKATKFKTVNHGEFRMCAEAIGLEILINDKWIKCLSDDLVFVNVDDKSVDSHVEYSDDEKYMIIHGKFDTFILDTEDEKISLYRITVREVPIWSEEIAIMGDSQRHFDSCSGKHYYIQFPFVSYDDFSSIRNSYVTERIKQIIKMKENY